MVKNGKYRFTLDADLLTLRALIAVVDRGSFSAAALHIGRSQSAVSLQIAKLEARMAVRLLERTSRKVRQTPAGEIFIAYARRIITLADEGLSAVTTLEVSAPFRLGFAEYLVPQHLQTLLTRFKRLQPNAKVELHLGAGFSLHRDLVKNRLDVVVAGPEAEDGQLLMSEPLVWAAAEDATPFGDLDSVPLVLMQPPCSYRQAAFDALTAADIPWHVAVSANSIQGVQSAVAAGLGFTVIPYSAVNPHLKIVRHGVPLLPDTRINVYWDRSNPHPLVNRFIHFLTEALDSMGIYGAAAA